MIYQVRDTSGRKYLERETRDEILYWLHNRPVHLYEVWVLDRNPGDLLFVAPATVFIKETGPNSPRNERTNPDAYKVSIK